MYNALRDFYALGDDEATEFMGVMDIIHPYGKVGELPYNKKGDTVGFGANINDPKFLLSLSSRIKTFTESVDEEKVIDNINNMIHNAQKIIFLGFAFHPINMSLFESRNTNNKMTPQCYLTSYGISIFNTGKIERDIAKLFNINSEQFLSNRKYFNSQGCKCADLFDDFKSALYY